MKSVSFGLRPLGVASVFFKELPGLALMKRNKLAAVSHPQHRKPMGSFPRVSSKQLAQTPQGLAGPRGASLVSQGGAASLPIVLSVLLSAGQVVGVQRPLSGTDPAEETRRHWEGPSLPFPPPSCRALCLSTGGHSTPVLCRTSLPSLAKIGADLV